MFNPVTQNRPREQIFGSAQEVLKGTSRLARLCTFNAQLANLGYPYARTTTLAKVVEIWQQALETSKGRIASVEGFKEKLVKDLEPTRKVMPTTISDVLTSQFMFVTTAEGMQKVARRILKDCNSVMVPPVKKSTAGLTGPTLLVSYPRSNLNDEFSLIAYVIKWTNREEIGGNLLYNAFLHHLAGDRSLGISIPRHSGFDFSKKLYKTAEGELSPLGSASSLALKASFQSVVSSFDPSLDLHGKEILVMERVQGENLFEFGRFKYDSLTDPQRTQLFYNLGKLAVLDVLFGNHDRLLQFSMDPDNRYQLDSYEANLGNIMLAQENENGDPSLYAIDNEIHSDFIGNSNYLTFIRLLFGTKNPEITMAEHMAKSLESGFINTTEDAKPNPKDALMQLAPILNDLATLAVPALESGIREMIGILRTTLIPAWNSERSVLLKTQLATLHPALLNAVDERISTFATTLKESL